MVIFFRGCVFRGWIFPRRKPPSFSLVSAVERIDDTDGERDSALKLSGRAEFFWNTKAPSVLIAHLDVLDQILTTEGMFLREGMHLGRCKN